MERPELTRELDSKLFLDFYYLKEELVAFCREQGLPVTGGKQEITKRIAHFLETGEILQTQPVSRNIKPAVSEITEDTLIEENIVCSQQHRAFFTEHIGKNFSFNVAFQKWLKENSGKTYRDAIEAYEQIRQEKKKSKTTIEKQFEYNTYIRDFFKDNKGKSLEEAIACWNFKKSQKGHNRYEPSDLEALK